MRLIVLVGDATTDRVTLDGIIPSVRVVDGRERRGQRINMSEAESLLKIRYCNSDARILPDHSKGAVQVLRGCNKSE